MLSLPGSHFPALVLRYGRRATHSWWAAYCLQCKWEAWMNASLTHFIVPIKPGSAISHGAVKLLITDVEETRLVKSEFILHGDQGSPPQRKPQSPLGTCVLSQNLWDGNDLTCVILLILRAERCLVKKCWLTGALALLFVLVVGADPSFMDLLCRQYGGNLCKTKSMGISFACYKK